MRRREFIAGVGTAGRLPRTASAQRAQPIKRIGILENTAEGDPDTQSLIDTFQRRLQELGWVHSRNVQFEVRWSAGRVERFREHAAELVGRPIYQCSSPASLSSRSILRPPKRSVSTLLRLSSIAQTR